MNPLTLQTVFRVLVVASLVLPLIGFGNQLWVESGASEAELAVLTWSGHGGVYDVTEEGEVADTEVGGQLWVLGVLGLIVVAGVTLTIGLWFFKRWARRGWTIITSVCLPSAVFLGWCVTPAFTQFCNDLSMVVAGAILALSYASALAEKFNRN
jgi:hypothetical protein